MNDKKINYDTVGTFRQMEISETIKGEYNFIDAFQSTTKRTIEEMMNSGYGDKNKLAIGKFHLHEGAVVLDMARFGEDYLKPEEKEVLILTGNRYQAKFIGYSDKFFGADGHPALLYDVDVYSPGDFFRKVDFSEERLEEKKYHYRVMNSLVRDFYKNLNTNIGGEYPREPKEYREWKKDFKAYVYNQLDKIYDIKISN